MMSLSFNQKMTVSMALEAPGLLPQLVLLKNWSISTKVPSLVCFSFYLVLFFVLLHSLLVSHPISSGFSVGFEDESNLFTWNVCVTGPPGTDYAGGIFQAVIKFSDDYPNSPPKMYFTSEMWHPNSFLLYHLSRSLFFCSVFSIS
jgi:hypothetical protein